MKYSLVFLAVFSVIVVASPQSHHEESPQAISPQYALTKPGDIRVFAKGIVCSFCAQGLKQSFNEQAAIEQVVFSDSYNALDIVLKPGKTISDEDIDSILTQAGFVLDRVERNPKQKLSELIANPPIKQHQPRGYKEPKKSWFQKLFGK